MNHNTPSHHPSLSNLETGGPRDLGPGSILGVYTLIDPLDPELEHPLSPEESANLKRESKITIEAYRQKLEDEKCGQGKSHAP